MPNGSGCTGTASAEPSAAMRSSHQAALALIVGWPGAPGSGDRDRDAGDLAFQVAGPVSCTEVPLESTATVTGMSLTSNS